MTESIPETHPHPSQKKGDAGTLGLTLFPSVGSLTLGFVALLWCGVGAAGFFWALAALAAGSLFGIIFGIPKEATESPAPPATASAAKPASWLRANTNMEEISDWLTKLLVGAGLVELKTLPQAISSASRYVAASLTSSSRTPAALESIAASILIFFTIEGFIGGYLITRVFFQIAFLKSDQMLRRTPGEPQDRPPPGRTRSTLHSSALKEFAPKNPVCAAAASGPARRELTRRSFSRPPGQENPPCYP